MLLEFIDLNSPTIVIVNCYNQKAMGKEKWHRMRFEKSTKNDNRVYEEKNDKVEIKFEICKELECK